MYQPIEDRQEFTATVHEQDGLFLIGPINVEYPYNIYADASSLQLKEGNTIQAKPGYEHEGLPVRSGEAWVFIPFIRLPLKTPIVPVVTYDLNPEFTNGTCKPPPYA